MAGPASAEQGVAPNADWRELPLVSLFNRGAEFLRHLEYGHPAHRDLDRIPGAGISCSSGVACSGRERPEAADLDVLTFSERLFHCVQKRIHDERAIALGHSGTDLLADAIYEVSLGHSM